MADPGHGIDLSDPAIRRLMGKPDSEIVRPGEVASGKEIVQIAGDFDQGITSTTHLDAGKIEVLVAGKEHVLTVDVYAIPGEPTKLHLVCPRCHHMISIDETRKAIEWNPRAPSPLPPSYLRNLPRELVARGAVGILSVETFQCTWELADQMQDKGKDQNLILGGSLCRFRAAIDRNVLKEG